jgi:hypothetical protein
MDARVREVARGARDRAWAGGPDVEGCVGSDHHDPAALGAVHLDVREHLGLRGEQRAQAWRVDERRADPLHEYPLGCKP